MRRHTTHFPRARRALRRSGALLGWLPLRHRLLVGALPVVAFALTYGVDWTPSRYLATSAVAVALAAILALDHQHRREKTDAAWYRSIFETSPVGVIVGDANRRIVSCNRAMADMLGYEPEELVGTSGVALVHPNHEDALGPHVRGLLGGEIDRATVDHCYRRKDGSPIWVRVGLARIPGSRRYFVFFEDTHESRIARQELREKTMLLERAQEVGGVGTWVWDAATERTQWSEQLRRIYGLDDAVASEGNPHAFDEIVHPDDRAEVVRLQREAIERGSECSVEHRVVWPNGEVHWVRSRGNVELDETGAVVRQFGAVIDVTEEKHARVELEETAGLLERAQRVGGVGSWSWYPAEGREVWSEEAQRIFGFTEEEAATEDPELFFGVVHPEDREIVRSLAWSAFDTETPSDVEYRILRRCDGELRWVREHAVAELNSSGVVFRVLGAVTDITEQKQAADQLVATAAELMRAQQLGRVGSWAWYPHENRNVWSPEARAIYGLTDEQAEAGDPTLFFDLVHPDEREEVSVQAWRTFAAGTSCTTEHRIVRPDGELRWVRAQGDVELDAAGEPFRLVGVVIDVTEQRAANLELERLAFNDPVTGLTNRESFQRRLDLAVAQAERSRVASLAVLYIDLDDFKLVNDSFGHEAGNQLLREAADRLRHHTRARDLIGRQGGDEFLVLLYNVDEQAAMVVARNLLGALQAPFTVAGAEVHVSASVGISLMPHDALSGEEMLRHADIAMYAAKDAGRNNAQVYVRDGDDARAQISLTSGLHRALEREELCLHYQPVFDLVSGRMQSVEALIRWHHPERGLLPPIEFIPGAERNGLIAPISDWVVETACRQASEWLSQGLDLPVAFNLPPALWQPALMRRLLAVLDELDLPAGRMIVEITESALDDDLSRAEPLVDQLRDAGLRLAIDDFGTGHSSLSRLARLPVSTLKIDRSFISDIPHDAAAATLVTSIVQLANNLGLQALAEGIETEEQREFLVSRGCTEGQGFLMSRAVPAEAIPWLYRGSFLEHERAA
jgi:diguanylate cyclase (GGDEF)-like protein/PAS domain S-box-containing protein